VDRFGGESEGGTVNLDLSGGMEPSVDEIQEDLPDMPVAREGVSMWMWDDNGGWGLPRMGVEALRTGDDTSHSVMLSLAFPDGRVCTTRTNAERMPVRNQRGRPRVLGAGPLRFECLEPFARWGVSFNGVVTLLEVADPLAGLTRPTGAPSDLPGERVALRLEVHSTMALPPWVQGSREPDGHFNSGEHRFEQLFKAAGTLTLNGVEARFVGGGLRIHRTGGDRGLFQDWYGHCWQSSLFPSGRGFGFIHYHPRPEGSARFSEGWFFDGAEIVPARVEGTPWLRGAAYGGEDVSFTLRSRERTVHIEAETSVSTFRRTGPAVENFESLVLQSGITRCRWGNEQSHGMIERSAFLKLPTESVKHRDG
jgi:hypothetical protein